MKTTHAASLKAKYEHYHANGMFVLMVTLSTFVTSDAFVKSGQIERFIDHDFLYKVLKRLPKKLRGRNCIDYDFIIERSPQSHWHIHGLMALKPDAAKKIWRDGALCKHLAGDLDSFKTAGEYRAFRINKFLIEPVREGLTPEVWIRYITKTRDYRASAQDELQAAA